MTIGDLPQFGTSNYASNTYGLAGLGGGLNQLHSTAATTPFIGALMATPENQFFGRQRNRDEEDYLQMILAQAQAKHLQEINKPAQENTVADKVTRRYVQVIVADPNENVPLEDCLLFHGEPKLTDLNDQELFFELDVKKMLEDHNKKRVKLINKKVKERVEHLEAAKIRDLKMVVVTIAEF